MKHYTPAGWVDEPGETIGPQWAEEKDYTQLLAAWDAKPEEFLSLVVYALTWRLNNASAIITGIYCDQWCAVAAKGAPHATGGMFPMSSDEGKVTTWIACDSVEWGIAATWKAMAEHFGEEDRGSVQKETGSG